MLIALCSKLYALSSAETTTDYRPMTAASNIDDRPQTTDGSKKLRRLRTKDRFHPALESLPIFALRSRETTTERRPMIAAKNIDDHRLPTADRRKELRA